MKRLWIAKQTSLILWYRIAGHEDHHCATEGEQGIVAGDRLKAIRESKGLSQGDIEARTGLLRYYISRVENGHTVLAIERLEKMARAMDVRLHQIFFDAHNGEAKELQLPKRASMKLSGKDGSVISRLSRLVSGIDDRGRRLLVGFAQKLAAR